MSEDFAVLHIHVHNSVFLAPLTLSEKRKHGRTAENDDRVNNYLDYLVRREERGCGGRI